MNFCPRCGTALTLRMDGGRHRPMCPAEGCGYTYYGDASIGTGAVVMRGDEILLIERRAPNRVWWQIPGGFVEVDEPIHTAIEREVMEETGIEARALDVVGFRHATGVPDRPIANIYDYQYAMSALKVGEPAKAVVTRGDQRISVMITPASRE